MTPLLHRARSTAIALVLGLGLVAGGVATPAPAVGSAPASVVVPARATSQKNSPIMKRSEYVKIKKGMTRKQVKRIVGSRGKVWECDPSGTCAVFFRATGYKRIVVISFDGRRVSAKSGWPGQRLDGYYDALFG